MDIISAVRIRAVNERPYFASALFAMTIVKRPGMRTFAVDKFGRMYIDPELIANGKPKKLSVSKTADHRAAQGETLQWTVEEAAYAMIHEVGHWLRKHHERAEPIIKGAECMFCSADLCNAAEDAEINDDDDMSRKLPEAYCLTPAKLGKQLGVELEDHQLWEVYYEQCRKAHEKMAKQAVGGEGSHAHMVRVADCGSGADGMARPWDQPGPGQKNPDGSDPVDGIRDAEGDMLRKAVARELREAAARGRGTVPAGWVRWAEEQLAAPQIAWERELAALVRNAITMASGCVDYSYTRPSRRGNFQGVLMPSLRRPKPEASVVIDTSMSMGKHDLSACLAEIDGILKAVGQRMVPVICCDAAAAPAQRVSRAFAIELIGGGGTDMGVGIAAAERLHSQVIIVLTDGYTPWPEKPPKGELVIAIVGDDNRASLDWNPPEYAKRVLRIRNRVEAAA